MGVDISQKTFVPMVSLFNHNRNTLLKSENTKIYDMYRGKRGALGKKEKKSEDQGGLR